MELTADSVEYQAAMPERRQPIATTRSMTMAISRPVGRAGGRGQRRPAGDARSGLPGTLRSEFTKIRSVRSTTGRCSPRSSWRGSAFAIVARGRSQQVERRPGVASIRQHQPDGRRLGELIIVVIGAW